MRRWPRLLVLPVVVCSCAIATAASGGAPPVREEASTAASPGTDTDRDGLSDSAEVRRYHTDPGKRDTDSDRLNDGAEVERYHTNPRKPDTDRDGLPDGDEVKRYHTDPRRRDTDRDGLRDGDEVVRYKTNPKSGHRRRRPPGQRGGSTGTRRTRANRTPTATASGTATRSTSPRRTCPSRTPTATGSATESSSAGVRIPSTPAATSASPTQATPVFRQERRLRRSARSRCARTTRS